MLRMPHHAVPAVADRVLARFRKTTAALELESDVRIWSVMEWSWTDDPSFHVDVRSDEGVWMGVVIDAEGGWRMAPLPITERLRWPPGRTDV
jgi:hypothetical protein